MEQPKRKLPRLREYDYSQIGAYFVTICTHDRKHIFATVGNGLDHSVLRLTQYGEIAAAELVNISNHFKGVRVDKFCIMPNHIHAIIFIGCDDEAERSRPFPTLSSIIGLYKSGVSRKAHALKPEMQIWQKSYYDEIIRNQQAYEENWQYIDGNRFKEYDTLK